MAAHGTSGWSLRGFFNNPFLGEIIAVEDEGSRNTAPLSHPLNERIRPCRIVEDKQLCRRLVNFANHRLATSSPQTPNYFHGVHETTERSFIKLRLGGEARNLDFFTLNANYIREFV